MGFLNPRALRWKIAALTAAACCAVATVIGLLVHRSTQDHGQRAGRDRAVTQLHAAEQEYARTGERPAAADLMTRDEVPGPLARDLAGLSRSGEYALWYDEKSPNWYWMWAAVPVDDRVPVGDKVLVVRTDMSAEVRGLQLLDRSIVKAVLAALAVTVPLAALATEPINRRLRHGARTARRIADGDLDARIGHRGRARDEITEMSTAMDVMAAALQQRLESERRFTADVAHELRTPLMGLVTAAGLLPDHDEAADLVRTEVDTLRGLTEDLLEISRLDAGVEHARLDEVPLGELVTDVVRRLGGVDEVSARDAHVVRTDPRRVERVLTNLITNAQRHGAAPVQVTVTGTRIAVRDHGPGFPAQLLDHGPQRFRTQAAERGRGHGLGLTIALGQAAVLGARLTFANAADGGAIATLELGDSVQLSRPSRCENTTPSGTYGTGGP
ncbi:MULTISPECIES: HAMP domain-containing sensor histidine kinase [unclassified Streptomyces]|uniref:sensor histidine kinase n=1 Tax=unclassified Streptomyces TaxID=2593676 RepID=UPI00136A819B|nr:MULTISPECIES: HAMP domain-containing sensor histidine kinase [unclassified Streptomyces]NEA00882.1 HAMP domain-containing histidine kinase [Streptomyces sp. SID10116]MYY80143.1 HAMP domain-containing protein [Streptomyces sp. SID335]MYZ13337.1 HAMP domain-containing protein [Streptomyces sp. SID337]NDZ85359.1 HAMP domain-containing histidine kinase [Streptomyces sp. SID10115]NEB46531.1 HAMP domain-containing histidine kinase [Streptomyces sp. SID339]